MELQVGTTGNSGKMVYLLDHPYGIVMAENSKLTVSDTGEQIYLDKVKIYDKEHSKHKHTPIIVLVTGDIKSGGISVSNTYGVSKNSGTTVMNFGSSFVKTVMSAGNG